MSLNIIKLEVGQMQANCYIASEEGSREAIIIDPGDDADYIIQKLQDNDLTPELIIATHGHVDHTIAVLELKLAYGIPFYMHKSDEFLLKRIEQTAKHFIGFDPGPPPKVDVYIADGSVLQAGGIKLKVLHTPGHTPGSVCLWSKNEKVVIVGDLIFEKGQVGRTDFSYSDKNDFIASLSKITSLPKDTIVYAGHGEKFSLGSFSTKE